MKSVAISILIFFLLGITSFCQNTVQSVISGNDNILVTQIVSDSLFHSHQRISILAIDKEVLSRFRIVFAYPTAEL
ncbi:MAG: hypothetical protein U9R60_13765, partial [Bacteroidota bacterium]|nr:hypothetical protein [Bacteroidota bacterium]